jgi:hypothetical protein
VDMDFVDEFVEVVFVAGTEVNERLDGLVGIGRNVLTLGTINDGDGVVGESGEVGDAVVYVGGFVDADERVGEDCEEVAEESEGGGLRFL